MWLSQCSTGYISFTQVILGNCHNVTWKETNRNTLNTIFCFCNLKFIKFSTIKYNMHLTYCIQKLVMYRHNLDHIASTNNSPEHQKH